MAKKRIQKTRGRGVTPGERVATLSDEKNDENVSCSSKKKKRKKQKIKKNETANDEEYIWFC